LLFQNIDGKINNKNEVTIDVKTQMQVSTYIEILKLYTLKKKIKVHKIDIKYKLRFNITHLF